MEIRADPATSDLLRAAGIEIRDGVIRAAGKPRSICRTTRPPISSKGNDLEYGIK
jgi:hypothetical protein